MGHLDNDNILQDIENELQMTPGVTDELADSFKKLGNVKAPTKLGDFKMVVVKSNQQIDTPM